jgi:DHA1 family bicyclomycin/chloramphenicol resistance-like MFS transporter
MRRTSAAALVAPGLGLIATGGLGLSLLLVREPSLVGVMGPVGLSAFGMGFVLPATTTAALAPFPHAAGAAASMLGFLQMGSGLAIGSLGAALGDPVLALATLIPLMSLVAGLFHIGYRRGVGRGAVTG